MKYNIIYCDPPWEYKPSGSKKNSRGMAKQHYDTITTDSICRIPIRKICNDNAICLMWSTFPNIDQARESSPIKSKIMNGASRFSSYCHH